MNPQPYLEMDSLDLMKLCDWREAEGEGTVGKRGVAWVIWNRSSHPSWWGGPSLESVILKPYQFSSFNIGTAREKDWPNDSEPAFIACSEVCEMVYRRMDYDPTFGAQYYHDISIPTPQKWIDAGYRLTLEVGRFKFFREG